MSGVHERDRSPTYFAPVDIAADLMDEITKYVMNENRCPKKWRFALGFMTFEQVRESYNSWKGSMAHRDAHRTVRSMDKLFNKLFIKEWRNGNGEKHSH